MKRTSFARRLSGDKLGGDRMTLLWETVAADFEFEGSWRDVSVPDVSLCDWEATIAALRSSTFALTYLVGGAAAPMPERLSECFPPDRPGVLKVDLGGPVLNCHFFSPSEIEFD